MKLTTSEKLRLIGEALITIGLLLLVYLAVFQILRWLTSAYPGGVDRVWVFGDWIVYVREKSIRSLPPLVYVLLAVPIILFVYWRLRRRLRQYELNHIISELHYIAQGNYEHRIRGKLDRDLQDVVDSIHLLVDSTVQAMEEERRVEQTKDELITNVSHDIRTPLTSIIGYLGLVENNRYPDTQAAKEYVHIAYEKSRQMKTLVDDLFEYTTISHSDAQLDAHNFDMIRLLEQLAVDFQIELDTKEMTMAIKSSADHLLMEGDADRLVRVFNNLFSNAVKYGRAGTEIIVQVEKVGDRAEITVTNEGREIAPHALRQIFERFYRTDEARSKSGESAGLGLAIAQGITELHGGTIEAESADGRTSFTIRLPLRQDAPVPPSPTDL